MNALARVDPFAGALTALEKDFPPTFTLEVDDHVFRNVGGFEAAAYISATMEGMKRQANRMGYDVVIIDNPSRRVWEYRFVRRPDAVRPVATKVVPSLEA